MSRVEISTVGTPPVDLYQFPCRDDNFGVLVHDPMTHACAAIDAPSDTAVRKALEATGWQLTHILVTHQHFDHIEGIPALKEEYGCEVIAPEKGRGVIPGVDRFVREGEKVYVGSLEAQVWETPGHCPDHITYWFKKQNIIFVADVLFAMGCGRVFDNAFAGMWTSLRRLAELPDQTLAYFGHEYTLSNANFALSIEPDNAVLQKRVVEVTAARARGEATSPTTIGLEKATNPFLRASDAGIQQRLGMTGAALGAVFQELRERKNRF